MEENGQNLQNKPDENIAIFANKERIDSLYKALQPSQTKKRYADTAQTMEIKWRSCFHAFIY